MLFIRRLMRRIITFDFDMTLFDHATWSIPESANEALRKLKENGEILVLATGRDMDNYYSRPLLDIMNMDARIEQNGTKIIADGKLIYNHLMDKGLLRRMMDYCRDRRYGFGFTIGDDDYYVCPDVIREMDLKRWGECGRKFRDPELILSMDVRTAAFCGTPEAIEDMRHQFPEVRLCSFAGFPGADVMEKECSKAEGLKKLCRYYGVSGEDVFSFGDSMNDYEILSEAGTGIAMGNACEKLKEAADYVTTAIDRDGIWNACRHFNLI